VAYLLTELENHMATKRHVVHVKTPKRMKLTAGEIEALKPHFRAALANVVSARSESESILTETNFPVIANKPRKGRKGAAKKGTKKGARKTGKKK